MSHSTTGLLKIRMGILTAEGLSRDRFSELFVRGAISAETNSRGQFPLPETIHRVVKNLPSRIEQRERVPE